MFKFSLIIILLFIYQASYSDAIEEQSIPSSLAKSSLLLQSDRFGSLAVAVGERGHVLYSYDNEDWLQSSVETQQTLTNVFMLNENQGWAVGHDAIVLETSDGGKKWKKVFSNIDEEAPLLDVYFKDDKNGMVIGAYSLFYLTEDGGKTWKKNELNITNVESKDEATFTDIIDIHLNDIAYAGNERFYIAAESGHVLRSDDNARSWINLELPYQGSFFGVLPLSYDEVLVYGLRGHLYLSSDAGKTWKKIKTETSEMLTDATRLTNGTILVTGLAGTLLKSSDNGISFSSVKLNHRHGLTSVLENKDGSILLTSDHGLDVLKQGYLSKD